MKTHILYTYKADLSIESINIRGILELGSIFLMNLVSLEYFLTNKTQNMNLNALLSEKIGTIFFAMTRCSLLYTLSKVMAMWKVKLY